MFVKIYWIIWAAAAIAVVPLFLTGNLTMTAVVAFGFVSFGLIFMGMMSVIPSTTTHRSPPKAPRTRASFRTVVSFLLRFCSLQAGETSARMRSASTLL